MNECHNEKYIENGVVKDKGEFNDNILLKNGVVYEVLRVIDGIPLFLERHLKRMENSFKIINKTLKYTEDEIKKHINKLIEVNNTSTGNIKLIIDSYSEEKHLMIYFVKHSYPSEQEYDEGVKTILYFGERQNPNAKIINGNFREAVNQAIKANNVYEAILVDRNGFVTEGSRSNIFMVKNNEVFTSPLHDVLPGVTRSTVIDLCIDNNIKIIEDKISYKTMCSFDGLFITGTSPKILPICAVDKINFNSSSNDLILKLMKLYDKNINNYIEIRKNNF
ncbi:branched chain amino acid aminotransferase [Clostridium polyendosporum]|uniref:Branched chain amino acid aminotransferase n=1 Tax=Clostridium polyendosporum TaxID=69208 RepID=A0A919RX66_9CLOT|nr:aminotransferase class IV [Clostridium polyendosporum]GIM28130.1 branched chain amino acid aminotransferase [Clostridium polyendosporum]